MHIHTTENDTLYLSVWVSSTQSRMKDENQF